MVQTKSTNIVTYNMHGFNQGVMTISELCEKYNFVFVQEHWLAPFDLHRIDAVCNKCLCLCLCFSTSAITTKINSRTHRYSITGFKFDLGLFRRSTWQLERYVAEYFGLFGFFSCGQRRCYAALIKSWDRLGCKVDWLVSAME